MLVRSVATTECEWDDMQRGWMLALAAYRLKLCSSCGGNLDETTDPDNEDGYTGDSVRCHRCTQIARMQKPFSAGDVEAPHAYLHRVELRRRRG